MDLSPFSCSENLSFILELLDESVNRFISESDEHFRITSEVFDDRDCSVFNDTDEEMKKNL